jgi:hypothetical protein
VATCTTRMNSVEAALVIQREKKEALTTQLTLRTAMDTEYAAMQVELAEARTHASAAKALTADKSELERELERICKDRDTLAELALAHGATTGLPRNLLEAPTAAYELSAEDEHTLAARLARVTKDRDVLAHRIKVMIMMHDDDGPDLSLELQAVAAERDDLVVRLAEATHGLSPEQARAFPYC